MSPLDFAWHILNLMLPAAGVAGITVALARLVWWRRLRAVPWRRMLGWAGAASLAALLSGLVVWGRDGAMYTYAAMVLFTAVAVLISGFGWRASD
jgi:hypothetical protein